MATSSIANLFSFFAPSKPPPPPPTSPPKFPPSHLSTTAAPSASSSHPGLAPLVLTNEAQSLPSCSADVMSVVCPSLAYANTMFFRSAYNVQVIVDDNEPEEKLLGRFRREVMRAGVIQECKRRRFFENKQDEKKRKSREAAKRNRRRRPQARTGPQDRQETSQSKKGDDDEDNWDLPEGDLPY
ncbi:UNVERIFIED_CONTAM: 30S ribosomal protein S21, chloroplastic [Sesamum radiatum]|uniref:30S ribosomal protein S21, chloroplastic n=2 Tax=Sesamum TaxID=4181 RepID=A0AAW2P4X3_SESRA